MQGILLLLITILLAGCARTTFDAATWQAAEPASGQRHAMVTDVIRTHLHPGTHVDTIRALLGRPDRSDDHQLVYLLEVLSIGEMFFLPLT